MGIGRQPCFFDLPEKNTNLVEDVEFLIPVKFLQILFSGSDKNLKIYHSVGGKGCHLFSISPKNSNLVEYVEIFPCQVSLSFGSLREEAEKSLNQSETWTVTSFFIGPGNISLVEDIGVLLSFEFR